ncbi:MAG: hypothetical protein RMM29_02710 [Planctomycetota bacterium]|nr:hypothetical protein [Planctomycetota bacterium]MCX8040160.1 hypothetical protein [Planctomycetota bacterium]MDW8372545.1 hypothetical protein [Planctomycetota bacterium]
MITLCPGHLELPEGVLPTDRVRPDGVVVHSLTAHALCAIDRHKWIESERARRDLGKNAVDDWIERYWRGWARAKLIEHLYGWRCWGAFGEDSFGLLARETVEYRVPREVLRQVANMLAEGAENLDIINWAIAAGQDLEPILWLLDRIDINAKRQRLLTDHIRLFAEIAT